MQALVLSNRNAAIYLNHLGCGLLRQGAFEDAVETFNDAVFIMKNGVCPFIDENISNNCLQAPSLQVHSIRERILRADQRMAFPKVLCKANDSFKILQLEEFSLVSAEELLLTSKQFLICPVSIAKTIAITLHVPMTKR